MSDAPIGEYALLSDCHGAALVHNSGAIDWLTLGRFDAPAIFAGLLDDDGGHWRIGPVDDADVRRRYLDGTMVLETTWTTDSGTVVLTDAMDIETDESGHNLGTGAAKAVLRHVRCTEGRVELDIDYAPRPEYGLVAPVLSRTDGALVARGGDSVLLLCSSLDLEGDDFTARRRVTIEEGEELYFVLHQADGWRDEPTPWAPARIEERMEATVEAWRRWAEIHQAYQGEWSDLVHHSGRVLQAMTFAPTGAIVAAPTTSLPETVGGVRNWDYRYTWVRDATLTLNALWVAACPDEADVFFRFIAHAALARLHRSEEMQIMYAVGGEHDLTERELSHLSGWRESRPVRVGNGAWEQTQLDAYGELLAAAHRLRDHLAGELDPVVRRFLCRLADAAADRWTEKDHGIWEIRGEPQHYMHSKLMCWLALDRAVDMADMLGADERVPGWKETREDIRSSILTEAWNDEIGAFVQVYGGSELDAASLLIPIVGFLPGDDERVLSTIEAIERELTDEYGLVYRYRGDDGLPGEEGAFLLCTFWLAHAHAHAGRVERAREIFERGCEYLNDVDLLAEEVDPESGELRGNFPQSFSHIGLVNAAWAIECAKRAK